MVDCWSCGFPNDAEDEHQACTACQVVGFEGDRPLLAPSTDTVIDLTMSDVDDDSDVVLIGYWKGERDGTETDEEEEPQFWDVEETPESLFRTPNAEEEYQWMQQMFVHREPYCDCYLSEAGKAIIDVRCQVRTA